MALKPGDLVTVQSFGARASMSVERAPRLIRFLRLRQRLELRQPRGAGEPSSAEQSLRYPAEPLLFGELRPGGTVEASGWFPQAHSALAAPLTAPLLA